MNVRGLATDIKRRDTFSWLKGHKADIYCLQDIHCKPTQVNYWAAEWGFKCIIAPYKSDSRGTAIFFNNTLEFKIHQVENDPGGNYNIIDIEMGGKRLTLLNLYGPNKDDPGFYRNLQTCIENIGNVSTIICGDWNLVLDQELDTSGYLHANNIEAQRQVLRFKEDLNLIDVWRATHPDIKRFSWRQAGQSLKQSRLDFFLTSADVYNQISSSDIVAGYKTDHSLLHINIKPCNLSHGKGFWKFNALLLADKEYVKKVKHTISEIIKQYKKTEQNESTPVSETEFIIDDQLFWETLKMEIRKMTISYSSFKKRERVKEEKDLMEAINNLETSLSNNPNTQLKEDLQEKQMALETLREVAVKASMIRSRARWVELGERPTKYFCNMEKRNYSNKAVSFIQVGDKIITEQKEILQEQATFYKELYRSKYTETEGPLEYFFQEDNIDKLTEAEKHKCEGFITEEEIKETIKICQIISRLEMMGLP